jgi:hypothetical protein
MPRRRTKRAALLHLNDAAWFKDSARGKDFREGFGRSEHVAQLLPEALTEAGFWFLLQAARLTSTFHSFQWMSKFVLSTEWTVEDFAEFLEVQGGPFAKYPKGGLSFYETIVLQMIWADEIHLTKIVDALTAYLVDVTACAYRHNPTLVPSKARFDLDFVRRFRTINDAVRGSALAELERISRSGFSEILSEAKRVTSCIVPSDNEAELRRIVRLRNEIVHKQGSYPEIIDSMFKRPRKAKEYFQTQARRHREGRNRCRNNCWSF